jgi:hypothetical protein
MDSIYVVGTVSNVSCDVEKDLNRVLSSLRRFNFLGAYLVESDSTDDTINILQKMKKDNNKIDFVAKGNLKELFSDRVERIRHCRNIYVNYLRNLDKQDFPDYVAVVDLDGVNSRLTNRAINSSFTRLDWDVVTANQSGGYYDIFALRAEGWQTGNCFDELQRLKDEIVSKLQTEYKDYSKFQTLRLFDQARVHAIYSKMRKIAVDHPWISVDSAFGGFAIYKSHIFKQFDYGDFLENGDSEHVIFHEKIIKSGGKIFINPAMINCRWNTYNVNKFFIVRQIRQLISKNLRFLSFRAKQF